MQALVEGAGGCLLILGALPLAAYVSFARDPGNGFATSLIALGCALLCRQREFARLVRVIQQ